MSEDNHSTTHDKNGAETQASPVIDFATLIASFGSASMIAMGLMPDPRSGELTQDLVVARQNIEILSLLQEKTRGNLSAREDELLQRMIGELRMAYVEAARNQP